MADEITKLVTDARRFAFIYLRQDLTSGMFNRLADALEAEHQRQGRQPRRQPRRRALADALEAERNRANEAAQLAVGFRDALWKTRAERDRFADDLVKTGEDADRYLAERDALRAAIREVMEHEMSCYGKSETWIFLSRAVESIPSTPKEKP